MMGEAKHETRAVFTAILALNTPQERAHFLDEACRGKPELRQRVEALLRAHEQASSFLEEPAAPTPRKTIVFSPPLTEKPGDKIGRYKLLEEIGEGAFGRVFMAEQTDPVQRKVALKIIKAGMDTREVIARFEAERQALALMDHPNIAKVLDAGATETGRPYFVMELVRGVPITAYCEQQQLSTTDRLQLFMKVCNAVQHAHQKGIIHRDLKPTNILVTLIDGEAVPKVIDFGIAKALGQKLTEKTLFTAFHQMIGTPAYMSPEQAALSGVDVDTRSDIYSLGVLLYELLTGVTPFDQETLRKAALDEIRRFIRETEPPKPSTRLHALVAADVRRLHSKRETQTLESEEAVRASSRRLLQIKETIRLIRGDLDWIVMKCLEKDRARRYETANSLADDIARHLKLEPVNAAAPSALYRAGKFIRRHKAGLAMATALVLLLVAGAVVSTWQAVRATRAEREQTRLRQQAEANEKKAQAEANKSLEILQFLNSMLNGAGQSLAQHREKAMPREILDQTADRIAKELTNQPDVEARLFSTLGGIYRLIGENEKAEAMFRQALATQRKLLGGEHVDVAQSLNSLAWALLDKSTFAEAETVSRQALAMRRRLLGKENRDVAWSLAQLALVLREESLSSEAEDLEREALAMRRRLLGEEHREVASSLNDLAWILSDEGRLTEAEARSREALAMRRRLFGEEHPEVAQSLDQLALVLREEGRFTGVEDLDRQVLAMRRKLLGEEHREVAWSIANLGWALWDQGKWAEAETLFRQALAMQRKLLGEEHRDVAWSLNALASALKDQGKPAEAEPLLRQALAMQRKLLGEENLDVAWSLAHLALVLCDEGKLAEADTVCRQALAMRRKLLGEEHWEVAQSLAQLAFVLHEEGRLTEAETLFRQALAMQRKLLGEEHRDVTWSLNNLAWVLEDEGRLAEAVALFREGAEGGEPEAMNDLAWFLATCEAPDIRDGSNAVRLAEKTVAATGRQNPKYLDTLAAAYAEAGRFPDAVNAQQEAIALMEDENWKEEFASRLRLYKSGFPYRSDTLARRTWVLLAAGKFAEAEPLARECLALREKQIPDTWRAFNARSMLGGALLGQKKYTEAEPLLLAGYEGMKQRESQMSPDDRPRLEETLQRLVQLYDTTGRTNQAAEWKQKLAEFEKTETGNPPALPPR